MSRSRNIPIYRTRDGQTFRRPGKPMAEITIKYEHVIPSVNQLSILQQWLRPGMLAFLVGSYIAGMTDTAVRIRDERAAMLDEVAKKEPELLPDGKKNPKAGQPVIVKQGDMEITLFDTPEKGEEFKQRERELFDGVLTIRVERKLTMADIEKIERDRLAHPRGKENEEFAVDFSVLLPFIQTTMSDEPSTPSSTTGPQLVEPERPSQG